MYTTDIPFVIYEPVYVDAPARTVETTSTFTNLFSQYTTWAITAQNNLLLYLRNDTKANENNLNNSLSKVITYERKLNQLSLNANQRKQYLEYKAQVHSTFGQYKITW
jgi:hypothetical protein